MVSSLPHLCLSSFCRRVCLVSSNTHILKLIPSTSTTLLAPSPFATAHETFTAPSIARRPKPLPVSSPSFTSRQRQVPESLTYRRPTRRATRLVQNHNHHHQLFDVAQTRFTATPELRQPYSHFVSSVHRHLRQKSRLGSPSKRAGVDIFASSSTTCSAFAASPKQPNISGDARNLAAIRQSLSYSTLSFPAVIASPTLPSSNPLARHLWTGSLSSESLHHDLFSCESHCSLPTPFLFALLGRTRRRFLFRHGLFDII